MLTEAFDLAGTGDAIDGRPEQQGKEDAKVREGIAAHMALDGLDGLEEFGQIDGFDEGPDEAGEMIGIEALVERFGANSPWKRSGRLMSVPAWVRRGPGRAETAWSARRACRPRQTGGAGQRSGAAVGDGCPSRAVAGWETGSGWGVIIVTPSGVLRERISIP